MISNPILTKAVPQPIIDLTIVPQSSNQAYLIRQSSRNTTEQANQYASSSRYRSPTTRRFSLPTKIRPIDPRSLEAGTAPMTNFPFPSSSTPHSSTSLSKNPFTSDRPLTPPEDELDSDGHGHGDCHRKSTPAWPPWKRKDSWTGWAMESVLTTNMVPSLVVQAFSTGILDATTYADFNTFASNQTGNTILLTVSIIGTIRVLLLLTGISLASFIGGAFIFGHIGLAVGVRRRIWLLISMTYQIICLLISCILLSPSGPSIFHIGSKHQWFILFLFANMSGAQVVMARQSSCQELPTAPMTSSYVDLVADPYLFVGPKHPKAGPRNRRLGYIVAMIVGALLGATMHRYAGSWVVVVVTIVLKCGVVVLFARAGAD